MKKIIFIISIVILLIIFLLFGIYMIEKTDQEQEENVNQLLCEGINTSIEIKDNFIIITAPQYNSNNEVVNAINQLKNEYSDTISIYELNFDNLEEKCMANIINKTGTYDVLKESKTYTILGYNQGEYKGSIQNQTHFYEIENFLEELQIIKKKEIKEEITYNDYEKNIDSEDYLLLIVSEKDIKEEVSANMKKVFPNIKQNTINKRSTLGEQIIKDLEEKTEVLNVYPQVFYFKNGQVIKNDKAFSESSFTEFKSEVIND